MLKTFLQLSAIVVLIFGQSACDSVNNSQTNSIQKNTAVEEVKKVNIPTFNADSAYAYMQKQVDFGPRTPGSKAREACAQWLIQKLSTYVDTVKVQDFKTRGWDGRIYDGKNIIASFKPKSRNRIILSAHYDTRPYSDHDSNPENHRKALDGANDGASGVGVLIEMARNMHQEKPEVGIDIILWDMEDFGPPVWEGSADEDQYWALGSQYWSQNLDPSEALPKYAILLDMVGGKDNIFPKEYFSQEYAPQLMNKIWEQADELGYGDFFLNETGLAVNDDHLPLNKFAGIPSVDIIGVERDGNYFKFYKHWHTQKDNMEGISKKTLDMVGRVVMHVVYTEN